MGRTVTAATVLALGIVAGAALVGTGCARGRASERFVEVKGLAEREVSADLALWPLRVAASANDLAGAQAQITGATQQVIEFLGRNQIPAASAELQNIQVTDAQTMRYGPDRPGAPRFASSSPPASCCRRPASSATAGRRSSSTASTRSSRR
jgi:hypothetical protein